MSRPLLDFNRACDALYTATGGLIIVVVLSIIAALIYRLFVDLLASGYAFYILSGFGVFGLLVLSIYLYFTFAPTKHMDKK